MFNIANSCLEHQKSGLKPIFQLLLAVQCRLLIVTYLKKLILMYNFPDFI